MLNKIVPLFSFFLLALIQVGFAFSQRTNDQNLVDSSFDDKPWQQVMIQQRSVLPFRLTLMKIQADVLQDNITKNPKNAGRLSGKLQELRAQYQADSTRLAELQSSDYISKRRQEDSVLTAYIDQHAELKDQYAGLFPTIDSLYRQAHAYAKRELWLSAVYPASSLLRISASLNKFKRDLKQQSQGNKSAYYSEHLEELKNELTSTYAAFDVETERQMLRALITEATRLAPNQRVLAIQKIASKSTASKESINRFVNDIFEFSRLKDPGYVLNRLLKSPGLLANYNDALLLFEIDLDSETKSLQQASEQRNSQLTDALVRYIQLKKLYAAEAQSGVSTKP